MTTHVKGQRADESLMGPGTSAEGPQDVVGDDEGLNTSRNDVVSGEGAHSLTLDFGSDGLDDFDGDVSNSGGAEGTTVP